LRFSLQKGKQGPQRSMGIFRFRFEGKENNYGGRGGCKAR
jgi:hypothetical protein